MFRIARHDEREPGMTGALIAVAGRERAVHAADLALRAGPTSPQLRAELDAELARLDPPRLWRSALAADRAVGSEHFREFYGPRVSREVIWRTTFATDYYAFLTRLDAAMDIIDRPFADNEAQLQALRDRRDGGVLTVLLTSDATSFLSAMCRDMALVRSLRVLNAIIDGEPADSPDASPLATLDLPAEVKIDPFDGQSLRIKKLPSGWLIYSIGPDLKDEGGR